MSYEGPGYSDPQSNQPDDPWAVPFWLEPEPVHAAPAAETRAGGAPATERSGNGGAVEGPPVTHFFFDDTAPRPAELPPATGLGRPAPTGSRPPARPRLGPVERRHLAVLVLGALGALLLLALLLGAVSGSEDDTSSEPTGKTSLTTTPTNDSAPTPFTDGGTGEMGDVLKEGGDGGGVPGDGTLVGGDGGGGPVPGGGAGPSGSGSTGGGAQASGGGAAPGGSSGAPPVVAGGGTPAPGAPAARAPGSQQNTSQFSSNGGAVRARASASDSGGGGGGAPSPAPPAGGGGSPSPGGGGGGGGGGGSASGGSSGSKNSTGASSNNTSTSPGTPNAG
jgi:hypothetical protein